MFFMFVIKYVNIIMYVGLKAIINIINSVLNFIVRKNSLYENNSYFATVICDNYKKTFKFLL